MPPPSPDPARSVRRPWWLVAGALTVAAAGGIAVLAGAIPDLAPALTAVRAAGVWAPALFVFLQVVLTVGPVPRTVFTVAAGVLFGSALGVLIAVVATVGAAVLAFWLVRLGTARLVARYADRRPMAWLRERLDHRGMLAVLSMRLLPMVPFPALNYAAGASGVRFVPYLLGTTLGVLPGTVAVVVVSDAVTGGAPDPRLLAVSVVCGILGGAGVLLASRRPAADA